MQTVYFETIGDRHLRRIGGLTVLERRIREVAKQGTTHVLIAAERIDLPRPLPVVIEFVPRTGTLPEGVRLERADILDGIELVDDAAAARAERALIARSNPREGPVAAFVNRLSMPITRSLSHRSLAVTPDHVTIAAIVVGLAAAALIVLRGDSVAFAIAGVLFALSSILGAVDGVLARLRFQKVPSLDRLSGAVVDSAVLAATGYALGGAWMWIGCAAAGVRLVLQFTVLRNRRA